MYAEELRKHMQTFTGEFSYSDMYLAMAANDRKEKRRLYGAVDDFVRRGEVEKTGKLFRYCGGVKKRRAGNFQDVLWRLLRARRIVTAEDMVELSGASDKHVTGWLRLLVKHEVVRKDKKVKGGIRYILLKDTVEPPQLKENAERMRRVREAKKRFLTAVDEFIKQTGGGE